ncbi:MAG: AlkA N-terminal domain-containing protein [Nevskia sp.]|nr:AlkA N-terminal domain-containing protein [Nevskia sp.]
MTAAADTLRLTLDYRPPLAWSALLEFLGGRGAAGVEAVVDGRYLRTVRLDGAEGWLAVSATTKRDQLAVELSPSLEPVADRLTIKLRQLLDLDADPQAIGRVLGADPILKPVVTAVPGLRVPGGFDGFELVLRAIVGQQVTVKAATTLFSRFAAAFGEATSTPFAELKFFTPRAQLIADADLQTLINLGLTERRARTIHSVAKAYSVGALRLEPGCDQAAELERFRGIAGIGHWTSNYVAMRALRDADAFPTGDLALCNALGGVKPKDADRAAEAWRPYRAYAALYLWWLLRMGSSRESGG